MCNIGHAMIGLGATLVILGVISICYGIYGLATFPQNYFNRVGAPIWAGVFVILTGAIGIVAGRKFVREGTSTKFTAAFLTLSIICIFVVMSQVGVSSWGLATYADCYLPYLGNFDSLDFGLSELNSYCWTLIYFHRVGVVVGPMEMLLCLVSSIICCTACCTCDNQPDSSGMVMQPTNPPRTVNNPAVL
ncbi:uncharacterized protein LOC118411010 [Branchiostoma floridae]|uniref:Uncharacterized protein LOC118411010 n=1 Tax=Branchiostoma floridae TaxID=7739 RepID=A0A9J7MIT0_BRAFL|nr:uncharacterized protein LOC118411010 [Branchiostoma floridae]XP_035668901.1 uncharacterized protein LOC118411010 [Branchiostoma floridae]